MANRFQLNCRQCRKSTLHETDPSTVNHVLHLLVTLLFCGIWLPIWILLAVTAPKPRVRCMTCGLAVGDRAPIEIEESARARAIRANDYNKEMADSAKTAARLSGEVVGAGLTAGAAGVQAGLKVGAAGVRGIWGALVATTLTVKTGLLASLVQVDRLLNKAGGDDPFMLWLLRFLLVATMLIVGTIVLFSVYKTSGAL